MNHSGLKSVYPNPTKLAPKITQLSNKCPTTITRNVTKSHNNVLVDVDASTSRNYTIHNFEVRHPRCVSSITKNFVYYTYSRAHYILLSSTVRIQLHVSALYVGHLKVEIQLTDQLYKMCGVIFEGVGNWVGGGTKSRCFNPPPHPQHPQKSPHTCCIAAL